MKMIKQEAGKLYKLDKYKNPEWIFIWDHPYGRNHVIGQLPVDEPYIFIRSEPMMSVWCNILFEDKTGWIHLRDHCILEITENGS
jgi:hypothetical protein